MVRAAPPPSPGPPTSGATGSEVRARRRFAVPQRYDLAGTVGPLVVGRRDPTARLAVREFWRASRTPDGPGTIRLRHDGGELVATGYGPGADWLVERAPALAGLPSASEEFAALAVADRTVGRLAARWPALLIPRSERVFQELLPTILQQKVTWVEAERSYRAVLRHFAKPAPGPGGLVLPPDPAAVAATPYWVFHPMGVERRRADTVRRAAAVARRLEQTVAVPADEASRRLRSLPGIGPWTVGELGRLAYGDPDAVSVGDFHLPHQVAWALAGEPRADDARMLRLLAPFAGHRARVVRLLLAAGGRPPRRGPRRPVRAFHRY